MEEHKNKKPYLRKGTKRKTDKSKKIEIINLILSIITALGTIGIIITIYLTFYSINKDDEWKRMERKIQTIELIKDFGHQMDNYQSFRNDILLDSNCHVLNPIDFRTATRIWRLNIDKSSKFEFLRDPMALLSKRNQIIGVLNELEIISEGYLQGVVDKEIFEKQLLYIIIIYYDYFYNFIIVSQKSFGDIYWRSLPNTYNSLIKDRENNK
jgi:hypothetical protein